MAHYRVFIDIMFDAPEPRSRHEIAYEWTHANERSYSRAKLDRTATTLMLELLCDIRDLVGECTVRLSDLEAQTRRD